jgi:hypothetical protein
MMDELVRGNTAAPDGTGYNDPPVNLKEIAEADFAKSQFHSYTFTHVEFRQMILKDDLSPAKLTNGKMVQAKLFWFSDDTGVAISADSWKGKVRYFAFGCNHDVDAKTFSSGCNLPCKKCNINIHQAWMDLIVEDSGWKMNEFSSRPQRGIRDYDRKVKFTRDLNEDERKAVIKFLAKVNCPGWTGVSIGGAGGGFRRAGEYEFRTTYDSSD